MPIRGRKPDPTRDRSRGFLRKRFRDYVRDCAEMSDPPRVEELARNLGIGVSTLRERCQKLFGCSPKKILLGLQIDHADELLRTTNLNNEEIARRSGFGSRETFLRAWREITGSRPSSRRSSLSQSSSSPQNQRF